MTMNNTLAAVLSHILNCEKVGRKEAIIKPASKMIKGVLTILKDEGYVGEFEEVVDGKGNILKVNLLGNINKCGVISPRYAVTKDNYEKFEKRFLPARDFGVLIVCTPKGMMTQKEAKEKGTGGKLAVYCY